MSGLAVRVRQAIPDEWERVRELRLRSSGRPDAIGSTPVREPALTLGV